MDYWLIEPLIGGTPLAISLSPEVLSSTVRSIEGVQREVEVRSSPFWRCFARGHLFDLLQALRRNLDAGTTQAALPSSHTAPWVVERLVFLQAHLSQQPTLAQAARQARPEPRRVLPSSQSRNRTNIPRTADRPSVAQGRMAGPPNPPPHRADCRRSRAPGPNPLHQAVQGPLRRDTQPIPRGPSGTKSRSFVTMFRGR